MKPGPGVRAVGTAVGIQLRKRQHIALEYEGSHSGTEQQIKVKKELSDFHSPPAQCQYGGSHNLHSDNQPSTPSLNDCTPCRVKVEPTDPQGWNVSHVPGGTGSQAVPPIHNPLYPYSHTPVAQRYCQQPNQPYPSPVKYENHYHGSATQHQLFNTTDSPITNSYSDALSLPMSVQHEPVPPDCPQSTFTFPPWGLAESGTTFGNLVGVDMTKSHEEEVGLGVEDNKKAYGGKRKLPQGRSRLKKEEEEDDGWEPPLWRQQLQNIVKMRETRDAPVDLMGAHKNAEQTTHVSPEVRRYQVLVSLMLSSQTKDQITAQAMTALKSHGLTIENIIETPEEIVAQLIHPVGFWRKKAGYIKRASQILLDKYGGDIPTTMDELCSLPGVGPKMSHLVMDIAWDSTSGIAVDTHVHRISHRLGWMRKATENPEITRTRLEKWLPKSEWRELNWLLVGFGQQRCLPNAPKCSSCLNEDICPASKLKNGGPWGKKRKTIKKEKTD